jgi:alpha-L-fucosidase
MKRFMLFALASALALSAATAQTQQKYAPNWESLDTRPTPAWFSHAKFGIFIHWGVYAVPSWGPKEEYAENYAHWLYNVKRQAEIDFHNRVYGEDFEYKQFAPLFKAELFDAEEWANVFARSGAKYVVLTSKHTDSYCLWPAPDSKNWNSVEVGPKRDLCGELTDAVRAKGIRMGFYYCLLEWHNPFSNLYKENPEAYIQTRLFPQLKDLVTRYAPDIVWADGEWDHPDTTWRSTEFLAWLFNEGPNPEVAVNDRWGKEFRHKHGGYYTTEYGTGMKDVDHPWEECRGIAHSFGYSRNETLADYESPRDLVLMLVDLVSRGGNLLLDIGPTADGRIPVIMEERLIQIGDWLKVNGEAIYGTSPWTRSCQWSDGEVPKVEYGKTYMSKYNVAELTGKPEDGKAAIEAFFTTQGDTLYAITPRWPRNGLAIRMPRPTETITVTLLGHDAPLPARYQDGALRIEVPDLAVEDLPCEYAYTFRIGHAHSP